MEQLTRRERRKYMRQNPTGRYIVKGSGLKGVLILDGKRIAQFDSAWEAKQIAGQLNTRELVTAVTRVQELEEALNLLLAIVEAEFKDDPEPDDLTSWKRAILAGRAALSAREPSPPRSHPMETGK